MSESWRRMDLEGGGVQSANLLLAGRLKGRARACRLLALFPLGLHRAYLDDGCGAWAYRVLSMLAVAALLLEQPLAAILPAAAALLWAAYDLRWVDDRVAAINKKLRMEVYLARGEGAPPGFRGRYPDDGGEGEPRRAPPFARQEAMLRELARRRGSGSD